MFQICLQRYAGYIDNNPQSPNYFNSSSYLEIKDIKRNDRFIQYGLVAAKMAIDDANLSNLTEEDRLKVGISVGSGIGGLETIYEGSLTINTREPKLSPFFIPSSLVNLLSGQISIKYGLKDLIIQWLQLVQLEPILLVTHQK